MDIISKILISNNIANTIKFSPTKLPNFGWSKETEIKYLNVNKCSYCYASSQTLIKPETVMIILNHRALKHSLSHLLMYFFSNAIEIVS